MVTGKRLLDPERAAIAVALRRQGLPIDALAEALGASEQQIRASLRLPDDAP